MTDYYAVISTAVASLDQSTESSRRAFYDRARTALLVELRKAEPPIKQQEFDRERLALEHAIRRVEQEAVKTVTPPVEPEPKAEIAVPVRPPAKNTEPLASGSRDKTTTVQKILSVLSNTTMTATVVVAMGLLLLLPTIFVFGAAWLAPIALDYLAWPGNIAFLFCLFVFLPLSLFRATRPASAVGFMVSSFVFGASTWFAGMFASYLYWRLLDRRCVVFLLRWRRATGNRRRFISRPVDGSWPTLCRGRPHIWRARYRGMDGGKSRKRSSVIIVHAAQSNAGYSCGQPSNRGNQGAVRAHRDRGGKASRGIARPDPRARDQRRSPVLCPICLRSITAT